MLRVAADYLRETGTTHTTTAFEPGLESAIFG